MGMATFAFHRHLNYWSQRATPCPGSGFMEYKVKEKPIANNMGAENGTYHQSGILDWIKGHLKKRTYSELSNNFCGLITSNEGR